MPGMHRKDKQKLPKVDPPPYYNDRDTIGHSSMPSGKRVLPQRRMGSYGGLPQGPSRNHRDDHADTWNEWNPGEFQRSYPKNKQNAAWYEQHKYGRLPGTDIDGWTRKYGPFPSEAKAANAIAKRAGKKKP